MDEGYRLSKSYREVFPRCRFVGIRYKNSDRVNGGYGYRWGQWFETGKFLPLEKLVTPEFAGQYPDAPAYIGLMKNKCPAPDEYFEYWIGMFLPPDCTVPQGYESIDLEYAAAGICWLQGPEDSLYGHEGECYERLVAEGMTVMAEEDGGVYFFERYVCPRFTSPDDQGEVTLDIGFFVK